MIVLNSIICGWCSSWRLTLCSLFNQKIFSSETFLTIFQPIIQNEKDIRTDDWIILKLYTVCTINLRTSRSEKWNKIFLSYFHNNIIIQNQFGVTYDLQSCIYVCWNGTSAFLRTPVSPQLWPTPPCFLLFPFPFLFYSNLVFSLRKTFTPFYRFRKVILYLADFSVLFDIAANFC